MKKVFSEVACVRGGFIREGQRKGGQAEAVLFLVALRLAHSSPQHN